MSRFTIGALLISMLAIGAHAADAPAPVPDAKDLTPQQLVENSAKKMLQELDANRAMYRADPAKLDALVGNVLLPNFDTEYSARLVLGNTGRPQLPSSANDLSTPSITRCCEIMARH